MSSDKSQASLKKAAENFRETMVSEFELEADFVDTVVGMFTTCASPLCEAAPAAAKTTRKPKAASDEAKPKRKKSAYNVFVREQMSSEEIKAVPHKEKMGRIAGMWAGLSPEDKEAFKAKADSENAEVVA